MKKEEKEVRRDRSYIRAYTHDWLVNGLTHYLTHSEQVCWLRLQLYAGNQSPPGIVPIPQDIPDPYPEIAASLRVRPSLLKSTIHKLENRGKISILPTHIIITSWDKEQPQLQTRFAGKDWEGVKGKKGVHVSGDPDKFVKGKYGHVVQR